MDYKNINISDNETIYKIMYYFKKDICKTYTNCRCDCPWGLEIKDNSFYGSHIVCKLDGFSCDELARSVNENIEFLKSKLDNNLLFNNIINTKRDFS